MAGISREDDLRDLAERMANNGNRRVPPPRVETRQDAIERLDMEVKAGLAQLRRLMERETSR
jgi:hypothetical protein